MSRLLLIACTISGTISPLPTQVLPTQVKLQSLGASLSLFSNHAFLQCLPSLGLSYTFAGYSIAPLLLIGALYAFSFAIIYRDKLPVSDSTKPKYFDIAVPFFATFATLFFSKLGISFIKYFITLISIVGYVLCITKMYQEKANFEQFMSLEIVGALGYFGFMLLLMLGWIPAMLFGFMTYIVGFFLAILSIFGLHIQIALNLYQFIAVILFIFHSAKVISIANQDKIFVDIQSSVIEICKLSYSLI